jgi:aryl-alcohol dehydrogenase-like predicted oxidoreductase
MHTRVIPSSGEPLPVIGCGTYKSFNIDATGREYGQLARVLQTLFAAGGSVIDSSPMYGHAEAIAGRLLTETASRGRAFIATKVWTSGHAKGIAQMEASFRHFHTEVIDLMQVHNLLDWRTHLPTMRQWKEQGRIRYVGLTHYTASGYADLEKAMLSEPVDFIQVNYSAADRSAEKRILPLAAERGIAVMVNLPFGGGELLRKLGSHPLPQWATDCDCNSWAQLLLKFILANPAVTCVIPGTGQPGHLIDNVQAGTGSLPDADSRHQIVATISML